MTMTSFRLILASLTSALVVGKTIIPVCLWWAEGPPFLLGTQRRQPLRALGLESLLAHAWLWLLWHFTPKSITVFPPVAGLTETGGGWWRFNPLDLIFLVPSMPTISSPLHLLFLDLYFHSPFSTLYFRPAHFSFSYIILSLFSSLSHPRIAIHRKYFYYCHL
jgi:hypothetical protein